MMMERNRRLLAALLLPGCILVWAAVVWLTAHRLAGQIDLGATCALIGWPALMVAVASWVFGRPGHWTSAWSVRAISGWVGVTCTVGHLVSAVAMSGWKPGISLMSWLVTVFALVVGGFMASAVNRIIRLLSDEAYRCELVNDQRLNWRGLEDDQVRRLAHDMFVGMFQGALADIAVAFVVVVVAIALFAAPMGRGHAVIVRSPAPTAVVVPAERPDYTRDGVTPDPGHNGQGYDGDN